MQNSKIHVIILGNHTIEEENRTTLKSVDQCKIILGYCMPSHPNITFEQCLNSGAIDEVFIESCKRG